jgi:hypothetical protein
MSIPQSIPTQSINKTVNHKNTEWKNNSNGRIDLRGKCYICENPSHRADSCKFNIAVCNKCGTMGHLATVCIKQQQYQRNAHQQHQLHDRSDDEGEQQKPNVEFMINSLKVLNKNNAISLIPTCNKLTAPPKITINVYMELGTGASLSSMSKMKTFDGLCTKVEMQLCGIYVEGYFADVRRAVVTISHAKDEIFIFDENVDTICGRGWLQKLKINTLQLNSISGVTSSSSMPEI